MKALVGAFNREKHLEGAFSVIVKLLWQSSFQALHLVHLQHVPQVDREVDGQRAAGPGLGRGQVVVVVGGQAQDLLSLRVSTSLKGGQCYNKDSSLREDDFICLPAGNIHFYYSLAFLRPEMFRLYR